MPLPRGTQQLTSPTLLQGISAVLQSMPVDLSQVDSLDQLEEPYQGTPVNRKFAEKVSKRLSSTNPYILDNRKIPIVSTSVSSSESSSVVFFPKQP